MRSVASNFSSLSCSYAPRLLSHSSQVETSLKKFYTHSLLTLQMIEQPRSVWKELPHPRLNSLHYSKLEAVGHDAVKLKVQKILSTDLQMRVKEMMFCSKAETINARCFFFVLLWKTKSSLWCSCKLHPAYMALSIYTHWVTEITRGRFHKDRVDWYAASGQS